MNHAAQTMSLQAAIAGRTSVRAYASKPVDRSVLLELMAAAVRAPTAMHGEPWHFVVVQDAGLLKRLSDRAKQVYSDEAARPQADRRVLDILAQPGFNVFYDAGTLVVICAGGTGHFEIADCWLAAQNLMLTAHAIGLGTCVIGLALSVLNLPDVKNELGIPAGTTAVAPIIVGMPQGESVPGTRKPPHVIAWR